VQLAGVRASSLPQPGQETQEMWTAWEMDGRTKPAHELWSQATLKGPGVPGKGLGCCVCTCLSRAPPH
jgi:hypothetical protein